MAIQGVGGQCALLCARSLVPRALHTQRVLSERLLA